MTPDDLASLIERVDAEVIDGARRYPEAGERLAAERSGRYAILTLAIAQLDAIGLAEIGELMRRAIDATHAGAADRPNEFYEWERDAYVSGGYGNILATAAARLRSTGGAR